MYLPIIEEGNAWLGSHAPNVITQGKTACASPLPATWSVQASIEAHLCRDGG